MNIEYRIALAALLIAGMIYASHQIDNKWRKTHPDHKPFKWGYFQALLFFPVGPLATIAYFIAAPFVGYSVTPTSVLYYSVFSIVGGFSGYILITRKRRWAWILVVIAQFNLINWIINFYYGSNRWNEFTKPRSNMTGEAIGDTRSARDTDTSL